jgi:hypothetical protein
MELRSCKSSHRKTARSSPRLYLAVLLLNDGKPEAAREFIDEANSGFVFPEEKKLLGRSGTETSARPLAFYDAAAVTQRVAVEAGAVLAFVQRCIRARRKLILSGRKPRDLVAIA